MISHRLHKVDEACYVKVVTKDIGVQPPMSKQALQCLPIPDGAEAIGQHRSNSHDTDDQYP